MRSAVKKRPTPTACPAPATASRGRRTCTPPRTPGEAITDLATVMRERAHAHRDLDAQHAWRAPASTHLARARAQLDELRRLLPALEEVHLDPIHARRIRLTCANCANHLAFLAAHARRGRR